MSGMSPQDLLAYIETYVSSNHCNAAATALILYEYIITFDDEVALLWSSKKRLSSAILFGGSRFVLLLLAVVYIACCLPMWNSSKPRCQTVGIVTGVVEASVFIIVAVASALRVHAVTGGKRALASLVFALALVPAAMNIFIALKTSYEVVYLSAFAICTGRCNGNTDALHELVEIVTRTCSIAADILVLAATWYHLHSPAARPLNTFDDNRTLVNCLIQDGTVFFVALLILNIVNLLVWFYAKWTSINMVVLPVSAILISRSILNLRQVAYNLEDESGASDDAIFDSGEMVWGSGMLPEYSIMMCTKDLEAKSMHTSLSRSSTVLPQP